MSGMRSWSSLRDSSRLDVLERALARSAAGDFTALIGDQGDDQLARIANAFDATNASVRSALHEVAAVTEAMRQQWQEISQIGEFLSSSAETTVTDTLAAQTAAAGVSENMHVVASANEELAATVSQIAASASHAVSIAQAAVGNATEAESAARALSAEAEQLGSISSLISDLARQTRLLALNARIEASRNSSDNSGFVVVAGEVKALAGHSAEATGRVGERVAQIRRGTSSVNDAMAVLLADLNRVTDSQNSIASTVQQQLAATHEISNVAGISAAGSREITENILRISHVMRRIAYGGSQARNTASELAGLDARLAEVTGRFVLGDRAADSGEAKVRATAFVRDGVTVIKNDVTGSGLNELDYQGDWCHSDANEQSGDSDAYGSMPGDTVTLRFVGSQAAFFGVTDAHHGMAAISVDGGAEVELDEYSEHRTIGAKLWQSGPLPHGEHTLTLRVLERKNPASRYYWVTIDRVEVS